MLTVVLSLLAGAAYACEITSHGKPMGAQDDGGVAACTPRTASFWE
jgi:hypothetical protein